MANAVLTTSESSAYDDQIEDRYHFPNTYLNQVKQALGDFILYYEPRRTTGPSSATGRPALPGVRVPFRSWSMRGSYRGAYTQLGFDGGLEAGKPKARCCCK